MHITFGNVRHVIVEQEVRCALRCVWAPKCGEVGVKFGADCSVCGDAGIGGDVCVVGVPGVRPCEVDSLLDTGTSSFESGLTVVYAGWLACLLAADVDRILYAQNPML